MRAHLFFMMNRLGHLLLFSVFLSGSLLWAETLVGTCAEVADGDTLTLLLPDKQVQKLRLYGVDAPEKSQDYGAFAGKRLEEMVKGRELRAEVMSHDRYGRAVVRLYAGKTYINHELVAEGLAWHYEVYAPLDFDLAEAETLAAADKLGLWQHPHPVPPWEFRRGARPAAPNPDGKPFWITDRGKVHNARCKYFGVTQKGHYADACGDAENCNLCGGAQAEKSAWPAWWNVLAIVLFLFLLPLVILRLLLVRNRLNR